MRRSLRQRLQQPESIHSPCQSGDEDAEAEPDGRPDPGSDTCVDHPRRRRTDLERTWVIYDLNSVFHESRRRLCPTFNLTRADIVSGLAGSLTTWEEGVDGFLTSISEHDSILEHRSVLCGPTEIAELTDVKEFTKWLIDAEARMTVVSDESNESGAMRHLRSVASQPNVDRLICITSDPALGQTDLSVARFRNEDPLHWCWWDPLEPAKSTTWMGSYTNLDALAGIELIPDGDCDVALVDRKRREVFDRLEDFLKQQALKQQATDTDYQLFETALLIEVGGDEGMKQAALRWDDVLREVYTWQVWKDLGIRLAPRLYKRRNAVKSIRKYGNRQASSGHGVKTTTPASEQADEPPDVARSRRTGPHKQQTSTAADRWAIKQRSNLDIPNQDPATWLIVFKSLTELLDLDANALEARYTCAVEENFSSDEDISSSLRVDVRSIARDCVDKSNRDGLGVSMRVCRFAVDSILKGAGSTAGISHMDTRALTSVWSVAEQTLAAYKDEADGTACDLHGGHRTTIGKRNPHALLALMAKSFEHRADAIATEPDDFDWLEAVCRMVGYETWS